MCFYLVFFLVTMLTKRFEMCSLSYDDTKYIKKLLSLTLFLKETEQYFRDRDENFLGKNNKRFSVVVKAKFLCKHAHVFILEASPVPVRLSLFQACCFLSCCVLLKHLMFVVNQAVRDILLVNYYMEFLKRSSWFTELVQKNTLRKIQDKPIPNQL